MKVLVIVALLACGAFAQEGPKCQAPNGGGLGSVINEILTIFPIDRILETILTAITSDPKTQAVMELLSSPEFQEIIKGIIDQPAFTALSNFACSKLYIDVDYYLSLVGGFLGFPTRRAVRPPRINGFLRNIPAKKMLELLNKKLASDHYVQLAFQKVNSDEFGKLIETLQGNAAYVDMKNRLLALGVDVDRLIESIRKIFRP